MIEKQDEDFSCGSASASTILQYFYNQNVSEKDILDEVLRVGDDGIASFSDLEKAVEKFGFRGLGISLSFDKLKTLKIPAIVYLNYRNEGHFSVIKGIDGMENVALADPSWGNRKISRTQFQKIWHTREDKTLKGKALLLIPQDKEKINPNEEFLELPEQRNSYHKLLLKRI